MEGKGEFDVCKESIKNYGNREAGPCDLTKKDARKGEKVSALHDLIEQRNAVNALLREDCAEGAL